MGSNQGVTGAIGLRSQSPAGAARRARTSTGADPEEVLRGSSVVPGIVVESTGRGSRVAASRPEGITFTVSGDC